jgi:conjugal transfer pilus assembly protein TraL
MSDDKYYIPRYIDEPTKIILWTVDEFIAFMVPFLILFLCFNAPITAVAIGMALVLALKKIKGEHGHYFLLNVMYWYLPEMVKFKQTPPSYMRNFI